MDGTKGDGALPPASTHSSCGLNIFVFGLTGDIMTMYDLRLVTFLFIFLFFKRDDVKIEILYMYCIW